MKKMTEPDREKLFQLENKIKSLEIKVQNLEIELVSLKTSSTDRPETKNEANPSENQSDSEQTRAKEPFNFFQMLFNNSPLSGATGGLGNGIQEILNSLLNNNNLLEVLENGCTACRQAEKKAQEFASSFGSLAGNLETSLLMAKTIRSFATGEATSKDSAQLINLITTLLPLFLQTSNPRKQTEQNSGSERSKFTAAANTQNSPPNNSFPQANGEHSSFVEED